MNNSPLKDSRELWVLSIENESVHTELTQCDCETGCSCFHSSEPDRKNTIEMCRKWLDVSLSCIMFSRLHDACLSSHQVVVAVFAHEGSAAVGPCRVGTVLTHQIPIGFGEERRGKHSYRGQLWHKTVLKMHSFTKYDQLYQNSILFSFWRTHSFAWDYLMYHWSRFVLW